MENAKCWTRILNHFGVYTAKQYLEQVEEKGRAVEYARYLERAVDGMSDPAKPIVILGSDIRCENSQLVKGQQIIVSPYARRICLSGTITYHGDITVRDNIHNLETIQPKGGA